MGELERLGSGRHVIVTGAGTGIGKAIALRLAREGARLSLVGRRLAPLEAVAGEASERHGVRCVALSADVRDAGALEGAFDAACEEFGTLDACVANAGVGGPNEPSEDDRWEELIATNLTGTYHTLRAAERRLAPGPGRRDLVVISSILARIGVAGYTGYCASKAGLLGLVRALAAELAPNEIQVNAVCPGWVDTDMAREGLEGMAAALGVSFDEAYRTAMAAVPLGRMSAPEDVAGVVAWLLSPDARGVTGQGIDVNGGAFMQ